MTAAGKPLVKIADLSVIKLKVYVSGAQIGKIKTGQNCTVRIDNGEKGYSSPSPEQSPMFQKKLNLHLKSSRQKRNGLFSFMP